MTKAATVIQSWWRGNTERALMVFRRGHRDSMEMLRDFIEFLSAEIIQKAFRRYQSRWNRRLNPQHDDSNQAEHQRADAFVKVERVEDHKPFVGSKSALIVRRARRKRRTFFMELRKMERAASERESNRLDHSQS